MACAVTIYFDLETDAAICGVWQAIEDAGLPSAMLNMGYRPHITLSVCEQMDLDELKKNLPVLIASTPPIPVTFSQLGIFPGPDGVIFLGVTVNKMLANLHASYWRTADAYMGAASEYYRPDIWVPHVTLAYGLTPELVGQVVTVLLKTPLPAQGLATEFVVTDADEPNKVDLFAARLGSYL